MPFNLEIFLSLTMQYVFEKEKNALKNDDLQFFSYVNMGIASKDRDLKVDDKRNNVTNHFFFYSKSGSK